MELEKASNVAPNFREYNPDNSGQYLFIELLFLDKFSDHSPYYLYQILHCTLSIDRTILEIPPFFSAEKHIIQLGQVQSIDKEKKTITLMNGNVIGYSCLIMASGGHGASVTAGVHALMDALRMKPKIPSSFPILVDATADPAFHLHKHINQLIGGAHLVHLLDALIIESMSAAQQAPDLASSEKRLYEVQL